MDAEFSAGDEVTITSGMFVGLKGVITSVADAMERNLPIGDDVRDGRSFWVIMKIYGREVPVELKPQEMKRQ